MTNFELYDQLHITSKAVHQLMKCRKKEAQKKWGVKVVELMEDLKPMIREIIDAE